MSSPFKSPDSPSSGVNPFADDVNPYAAPRDDGYYLPTTQGLGASPFAGLWRQGNVLVMHNQAPLPDICVKSNQPASRRLKRKLSWHHPAVYLVILIHLLLYIIIALIVRKTATIHIGLSEEWFARRRRRMLLAWSTILLSVLLSVVAAMNVDDDTIWAPLTLIGSILLCLGAMIYGLLACRMVRPQRMTDTYIWLKGVHPDFLARLEPWQWNV